MKKKRKEKWRKFSLQMQNFFTGTLVEENRISVSENIECNILIVR
jgi:hypothetical protein